MNALLLVLVFAASAGLSAAFVGMLLAFDDEAREQVEDSLSRWRDRLIAWLDDDRSRFLW